jgi:hypothetical protein
VTRSGFKNLRHLLDGAGGPLCDVLSRAHHLCALEAALARCLGQPLADHVRVASVEQDTLVLQADSPAWATRLRYAEPDLLRLFRRVEGASQVRRLRVRVDTAGGDTRERRTPRGAPVISPGTAALLRDTADHVGDEGLRRALLRLASRSR